jgi:uncharacterized protein YbjT (DUF2867 family)
VVSALVRTLPPERFPEGVVTVRGDVLDRVSLAAALPGQEAVICVLGTASARRASTLLGDGTKNLVDAMIEAGVGRLVCVTLLGCGPSVTNTTRFYRWVVLRALSPMLPDKEAQELVVRQSTLEWTLVRPPRFVGGRARGHLRVIPEGGAGRLGRVVRADLAGFVVDTASGGHVREAVAVGS